ncbi:hypothetical protein PHJA_002792300 [Phtheirospermum japonicum]|uniref:Uncharacterized protein n=1 Tax=Phtheirospermum japonicum TaxID=374723 RepID=A0A830D762_9LAMI|nr:hypothetical protein PHJA_002792300 [Phtheirospermum japonicum]
MDENPDSLYPMFFGVSCAFFALKLLPEPEICDGKLLEISNNMLKGSAHLLGLLIWKIQKPELLQKLENAQKQIEQLKKIRSQDGKANEKVITIVAAREQSWFDERKKLRQQIDALTNELRVTETEKEKSTSVLTEKINQIEAVSLSKDKSIEEIKENLKNAENNLRREAQRHSNEILKHKTAFIELVSNQRQLEAEMGRALRQFEAAKQELDSALDQKDQSVLMAQRLSLELVKIRKDLEQKDQILSAMLRKSKLDTAEKEMLLKEVKLSKAVRKQVEIEPKHERHSLRNMLSKRVNVKSDGKGVDSRALMPGPYSNDATDEQKIAADVEHLEKWETYKVAIEQRRNLEIDAFAEQLRLKDENLEAFRWRLLSMDIESKRLHSHIENLDHDITNLRQENMKLGALLTDRESELHSLKEQLVLQFNPPNLQKLQLSPSLHEADVNQETVWSKVKVIKRKPKMNAIAEENEKINEMSENEQLKDIVLTLQYPNKEKQQDKKIDTLSPNHDLSQGSSKQGNLSMKMDIQALGVSYKIKRLKQQFLMLERLTGKQESSENGENENGLFGIKGFYTLLSLLNKQADRYQSLQGKMDNLCQRMQENDLNLNCGGSTVAKTEDETKRLEQFLDETFQLQRYMVATGQKLTEVQAKLASGFVGDAEKPENPESFDVKRFADSIRTLFQEVQRGLEIRISRIIGDLEGTLACDGIIHFKK